MRLLFLNQYGPGDPAPTARLLDELASYLRERGHEIEIVAQSHGYHGRPPAGGSRMRREVQALLSITRAGWRGRRPKPDIVLTLSSPPGLLVAGAAVAWRHGAVLAHWAMDLYPELAVALGEIPPDGNLRRIVRAAMGWAYRRSALTVALDEDMRRHLSVEYGIEARVLPPWAGRRSEQALANAPVAAPMEGAWTWLYSGNLGRAHEWETLLEAQRLLELRRVPVELVFQGDGAARAAAQARARELGLANCHWKGYVAEDDLVPTLLSCQALIVTQRPETRGLLWPSKLALLERLPRSILWVGPTDGDIARRLVARGGAGVFAPGDATGVAAWVEHVYLHPAAPDPPLTGEPGVEEGCATWEKWFREIARDL